MAAVTLSQFAAAVVISYLGLLSGFFLASLTREELPTAKKYFPWLEKLIILAVAAFVMDFFNVHVAAKAAAYALMLFFFVYSCSLRLAYVAFGAAIAAVSKDSNTLLVVAALVFLFGLLSGSGYFGSKLKRKDAVRGAAKVFANNLLYPAVAIVLFLAFG
ncbi:hypothetical protein HYV85_00500 [Candidatus Woesearchaeota archaeon]|nr:hypothetical protein [Candidatus Woesearchaeota archaeon]